MKKFAFSLQKLLNYKEQVFEIENTILSEMRGALARMEQELADLRQEHKDRSEHFNLQAAQGFLAHEMELHKMYLRVIDYRIEQKIIQIQLQKEAIQKQTQKVWEAKMEISTLEKLKEKKLEEYRYQETKATELFIEEFVSNKKASALAMG